MNEAIKKDRDLLVEGLHRMSLNLSDQMIDQLMAYLNLIEKWNRVYNLTAIRERDEMIKLHFLDSLSILNHVEMEHVLDVGSGASFGGESLGIVYDCADDAFGVGDGARDARGRWGENILGDGFRGVGFGGLCLGG